MKNRFSTLLKEAISLSHEEAIRLQSGVIDKNHFLLGIIRQGDSRTISLLKQTTASLPDLQKEIEAAIRENKGARIPVRNANRNSLYLTRDAERAIRDSQVLAAQQKSPLIEPEHLLLAILKDRDPTS
jgi:ATP-dependent Clp protease ATP-binding subunit ClpC